MKIFRASTTEIFGELETIHTHCVYAKSKESAKRKMTKYLKNWRGKCESTKEDIENGIFYFCFGETAIKLGWIEETTEEEIKKLLLEFALIN